MQNIFLKIKALLFVCFFLLLTNNLNANSSRSESGYKVSELGYRMIDDCMYTVFFWYDSDCMCGGVEADGPCGSINFTFHARPAYQEGFELEEVSSYNELNQRYELEGDLNNQNMVVTFFNVGPLGG